MAGAGLPKGVGSTVTSSEIVDATIVTADLADAAVTLAKTGTNLWTKGANVASATDVVLGADGDLFRITGTTTIDHIASTNFRSGSVIRLIFADVLTIRHGQASSGVNKLIRLCGAQDLVTAAESVITLVYDANDWHQIAVGTSTGTGAYARATSPTFVTPALGTPSALVATNASGTAAGLTAGNATQVASTTPGTGGLAVLDDATTDAVLTTLGFPTTFIHAPRQRTWDPAGLQAGGNFTMIADSAYFLYVGQVARALTPLYVRGQMVTAGSGTQAADIGLFTTTNPPNSGNQTLTPIASAFKTTLDDLTAAGPLIRGNSVALAVAMSVGAHLWVGIRVNMSIGQPIMVGAVFDRTRGQVLVKTTAGAFDGSTTYAGVIPAISAVGAPVAPYIWAGFD